MKVLIFGDIIGKPGRKALARLLPKWRQKHDVDFVIANAENLSHGIGVTESALKECQVAGVDFFTSGNHIWKKREIVTVLERPDPIILRPANYPPGLPGAGTRVLNIGVYSVLIINLMGRVFFKETLDCPFRGLDTILRSYHLKNTKPVEPDSEAVDHIFVDFHADATSEKNALGRYADGRVTAFWGTHSHIPTADCATLPDGTAYVTDVGMTGMRDSVIGANTAAVIQQFITQMGHPEMHDIAESGVVFTNAVLLTIPGSKGLPTFERVQEYVEV